VAQGVKVTIIYCAECGYERQTLDLAQDLMKEFQTDLAAIEIVPWFEGSFPLKVGDEVVHSMYRDGGFPESRDIVKAVREKMAS